MAKVFRYITYLLVEPVSAILVPWSSEMAQRPSLVVKKFLPIGNPKKMN